MKISIIVPVYNVSQYLHACINSIINQTFKELEIILIDDGSTDDSGKICDIYSAIDKRIKVIHQCNSGLSAARNVGIEIATGEYITFIDSDDYISTDYIERLLLGFSKIDIDIVMCDFKTVPEDSELSDNMQQENLPDNIIGLDNCQVIKEVYKARYHGVDFISVAKLYRKSLFKDNNIRFPSGKIHEDAFTTYKLFYASKQVVYLDIPMYFYRIRGGSITTSVFSLKRLDKITATKEECDFFLTEKQYELLSYALSDHLHEMKLMISRLNKCNHQYDKNKKLLAKQVKKDLNLYGPYTNISVKKQLYYRLLASFPFAVLADL